MAQNPLSSNIVNPPPGPQQSLLNSIFSTSATGKGGNPIGMDLFNFAGGILPKAMQDQITATTNDQFGRLGARFGTDLGTAISRGLGQAGAQQSQWALGDILGLGGTTAGFEFQGTQNALNRGLQEFLANNNQNLILQLLPMLLGGSVGG